MDVARNDGEEEQNTVDQSVLFHSGEHQDSQGGKEEVHDHDDDPLEHWYASHGDGGSRRVEIEEA